jgi:hypothetical protein
MPIRSKCGQLYAPDGYVVDEDMTVSLAPHRRPVSTGYSTSYLRRPPAPSSEKRPREMGQHQPLACPLCHLTLHQQRFRDHLSQL